MGCASSKVLESEGGDLPRVSRGISMAAPPQDCADHFHIVALTSSTYGILKLDPQNPSEEESKDGDPVKEMLRRLSNLESGAETAPQSWHEVSSMVENLKPGLDKINSAKQLISTGVGKAVGQISLQAEKPDTINVEEIMNEADDDVVQVSTEAKVNTAPTRKPKPFDQSLRIRTLEELDCRLGRSESVKSSALNSKKDVLARFNSVQDRTTTSTAISVTKASSASTESSRPDGIGSNVKKAHPLNTESDLFDTGFLGCYEKALTNLSEDDWNSVDSQDDTELDTDDRSGGVSKAMNVLSQTGLSGQQAPILEAETRMSKAKPSMSESKLSEQARPTNGSLATPVAAEGLVPITKPSALEKFEEICPPGGAKSVVLYTTSLRGIRKTFENCNNVKRIVESFGVLIDERDVSLHLEFRNELRELMDKVVTVPRLFIKGRYVGGAEEVSKLHELEKLGELLEGLPQEGSSRGLCDGCGGTRFLPCFDCSGSCKLVGAGNSIVRCPNCNENGLVQCPLCS